MTITGGTALPKEEIDRMVQEAEKFAEEDRRRREVAEARNLGDNLVYQTEKSLTEYGDRLPDADKSAIASAVDELKEALKGEDAPRIKSASEGLMQVSHKLAEQIYAQQQGPEAASAGEGGGAASDEEVVDAEIVEEGDAGKEETG